MGTPKCLVLCHEFNLSFFKKEKRVCSLKSGIHIIFVFLSGKINLLGPL